MEPRTQIIFKDPADLRPHRLQRHIPEPDKKSPEWVALVDSIQAGGILHPLIITGDNQIMDGGWRWRAARQINLTEVPCVIRAESEAAVVITESLLHRKQMTRGAAVYLALSLLPEFIQSAEYRRLQNLKRGVKTCENPLKSPKDSNCPSETVLEVCQRWGIAVETYKRAREVHNIFAKDTALKKEWEPRLLSGEKNLWNVLSAIGGAGADQSKRDQGVLTGQLELFGTAFTSLPKAARAWAKLETDQRRAVLQAWRKTAAALPQDLRSAMVQVLEEVGA
jgi:hypothetical protein